MCYDDHAKTLKNVTNQPQLNASKDGTNTSTQNLAKITDMDSTESNNSTYHEYPTSYENNENIDSTTTTASNNNTAESGSSVASRLSELINSNLPHLEKSTRSSLSFSQQQQQQPQQTPMPDLIQDCESDENEAESAIKNSHSISDESFHNQQLLSRNAPSSLSSNRKAIKKTKVNTFNQKEKIFSFFVC